MIFIPSGSFCLIIDLGAVKSALKTLYEHLSDGGVLLFEVEILKAVVQIDVWQGSTWHKSNGKMIILSQLATFDGELCNSICKYELAENNSIIHTEIEELKLRIYDLNKLEIMLKDCCFKSVRKVKAFDENALPDEHDEAVIYECKK